MREFTDYAEAAIKRFGLTGYNNLAREVGITKCSMSALRNGKTTPSEETFFKIVELAGMPKEEALIDLNLWRSKNNPELNKIWLRIAKLIGCIMAYLCAPVNAFAASLGAPEPRAVAQYATSLLICTIVGYTGTYAVKFIYKKYILCDKFVWWSMGFPLRDFCDYQDGLDVSYIWNIQGCFGFATCYEYGFVNFCFSLFYEMLYDLMFSISLANLFMFGFYR